MREGGREGGGEMSAFRGERVDSGGHNAGCIVCALFTHRVGGRERGVPHCKAKRTL